MFFGFLSGTGTVDLRVNGFPLVSGAETLRFQVMTCRVGVVCQNFGSTVIARPYGSPAFCTWVHLCDLLYHRGLSIHLINLLTVKPFKTASLLFKL
ncbi:MAG: hypothetical protein FJ220_04160 [Kiritimatiellaceae bacterium]|nr:hypothetical protein [Kiritimatiellaceae bacterium]